MASVVHVTAMNCVKNCSVLVMLSYLPNSLNRAVWLKVIPRYPVAWMVDI
jgi:hypothetical protein